MMSQHVDEMIDPDELRQLEKKVSIRETELQRVVL
jgi:hypothetical protein